MQGEELFENMKGYEYFKEQLDFIPEENRETLMSVYLDIVTNALLC